jgi:N-acetylmuramoyl-L-alanine amidase
MKGSVKMKKLILDAGHGIDTPGKRVPDNSMHEWEFNAKVAYYVSVMLVNYDGVQVQFTHDPTGKVDIPLAKRTDYANRWGADVLVSIHANASGNEWSEANGIETFVYTEASKNSLGLAQLMQKYLIEETGLKDRGVKKENLHMVRETKMPSCLVECGFMTNHKEADLLKSDSYRKKCAAAITKGIVEYLGLKPKVVPVKPKTSEVKSFRLVTGTFTDRVAAEKLADEIHDRYGVIVHVKEEV